jgi:hypothetical protein
MGPLILKEGTMPFDDLTREDVRRSGDLATEAPERVLIEEQNQLISIVEKMEQRLDRPEKWCKRKLYNEAETAFCLRGALVAETHLGYPWSTEYARWGGTYAIVDSIMDKVAAKHLRQPIKFGQARHVAFNNADATTHTDILKFLAEVKREIMTMEGCLS